MDEWPKDDEKIETSISVLHNALSTIRKCKGELIAQEDLINKLILESCKPYGQQTRVSCNCGQEYSVGINKGGTVSVNWL